MYAATVGGGTKLGNMFQLKLEAIIRPIKMHTEETVTTTLTI